MTEIAASKPTESKLSITCAVIIALCAVIGLPPTLYCGYAAWTANHPGDAHAAVTTSANFDVAFDMMIGCYLLLFVTALVWWVWRRQQKRTQVLVPNSRLKILSAHYGVEGIADRDVTNYLLSRLRGDAFAETIGADL